MALLDFAGCAIVISHDRFFLDRICTHLLVYEDDGKVRWFEENFSDYEEILKKSDPSRFGNRRSKYKKREDSVTTLTTFVPLPPSINQSRANPSNPSNP